METVVTTKKPSREGGRSGRSQGGAGTASTSTANKALITRHLRLVYDEIAGERIPDKMLDLLGKLDAKEEQRQ